MQTLKEEARDTTWSNSRRWNETRRQPSLSTGSISLTIPPPITRKESIELLQTTSWPITTDLILSWGKLSSTVSLDLIKDLWRTKSSLSLSTIFQAATSWETWGLTTLEDWIPSMEQWQGQLRFDQNSWMVPSYAKTATRLFLTLSNNSSTQFLRCVEMGSVKTGSTLTFLLTSLSLLIGRRWESRSIQEIFLQDLCQDHWMWYWEMRLLIRQSQEIDVSSQELLLLFQILWVCWSLEKKFRWVSEEIDLEETELLME